MLDTFFERLGPGTKVVVWLLSLFGILLFLGVTSKEVVGCWKESNIQEAKNVVPLRTVSQGTVCVSSCTELKRYAANITAQEFDNCLATCRRVYNPDTRTSTTGAPK